MRAQIESLLRVIAVCFIAFGAIRFTQAVLDLPLQRLGRLMLPPDSERSVQEFHASMLIQWLLSAAPALIGWLLILCRRGIATLMGPDEGWPLIAGRAVIVTGVGMTVYSLVDRVCNQAMLALNYDHGLLTTQLFFELMCTSIVFLPLGVLWLLMRRMTTSR